MMFRRIVTALCLALFATVAAGQQIRPGMAPGFRPGFSFLSTRPADDADVAAYIAKAYPTTPPTGTERGLLNDLVRGIKSDGNWTALDRIALLAVETQQASLVDLRNPNKTWATGGTITFTANRGWQGDGSTGYLDAGEAWAATGNQFVQNSAAYGVWCNATTASGVKPQIGNIVNAARSQINARSSAGNENFRMNDSTDDTFMVSNGSRLGHRAASRTGAAVKKGYFNGAVVASLTTASTGVNTANGALLRSITTYADDRLAAAYSGGSMTDAQISAMHSRLSTYLTAKGAN